MLPESCQNDHLVCASDHKIQWYHDKSQFSVNLFRRTVSSWEGINLKDAAITAYIKDMNDTRPKQYTVYL